MLSLNIRSHYGHVKLMSSSGVITYVPILDHLVLRGVENWHFLHLTSTVPNTALSATAPVGLRDESKP
jgi:hypothetical protein